MRLVPVVAALALLLGAAPARASDLEDGKKLLKDGRPAEAAVALAQSIAAGNRDAELLSMLVNAKGMGCDWRHMDAAVDELRQLAAQPGKRPAHPQAALLCVEGGREAGDPSSDDNQIKRVVGRHCERTARAAVRVRRASTAAARVRG